MLLKKIENIQVEDINFSDNTFVIEKFYINQDENNYNLPPVFIKSGSKYLPTLPVVQKNKTIEALVIEADEQIESLLFICANILNPSTSYKGIALRKFIELGNTIEDATIKLLPILKEKKGKQIAESLYKISLLPDVLLKIIHDKKMSVKNAYEFTRIKIDDIQYFCKFISNHSLTSSEFRILGELLFEIGKRDKLSFSDVIEKLSEIKNDDLNGTSIISFLKDIRFPEFRKYEKEYYELVNSLSLPPRVRIKEEINFETSEITLELKCKDEKELSFHIDKIKKSIDNGTFNKIFTHLQK